ncbi:alpha/beta hydrolase fold domain-containing protein [Sodalis glossinidius]|uniref:alpha/beta hydrolase fold domain-containing protein n=1 Tax=Sodalis glossinidius TaxID=63612 RepID=UPI0011D04954|nr:alpha/beta hydrolase fold domain-containing protein [Sodalis glossinidius]
MQALNGADAPPVESLVQARQVIVDAQKSVAIDMSGVDESEQIITVDGSAAEPEYRSPGQYRRGAAGICLFHGGGWVLGDYFTHKRLVRDLVVARGVVGIFAASFQYPYQDPLPNRSPAGGDSPYVFFRWWYSTSSIISPSACRWRCCRGMCMIIWATAPSGQG